MIDKTKSMQQPREVYVLQVKFLKPHHLIWTSFSNIFVPHSGIALVASNKQMNIFQPQQQ